MLWTTPVAKAARNATAKTMIAAAVAAITALVAAPCYSVNPDFEPGKGVLPCVPLLSAAS